MTTPAKIEPWMMKAAKQIDEIYIRANSICLQEGIAPIIAAHAPKQEWEAKEKALRELCFNLRAGCAYQTDKDYRIAFKIEAILNEGEK